MFLLNFCRTENHVHVHGDERIIRTSISNLSISSKLRIYIIICITFVINVSLGLMRIIISVHFVLN